MSQILSSHWLLANKTILKLSSKWTAGKPADERSLMDKPQEMKDYSEFVAEKHADFGELNLEMTDIEKELEIFKMEPLDGDVKSNFHDLKIDIETNFSNWALMNEFETAFGSYLNQEWLLCKSLLHEFQEKIGLWAEANLKTEDGQAPTVMQSRLRTKIEKYKERIPSLKWCRGDNFTTDHWLDLFRLLLIPKGTSVDHLTLGMLLNAGDHIVANLDKIKEINDRAYAEISIRESLRDIEIWSGSTEFTIVESKDTLENSIFLIKDWRESLSELGDQQRLVATLKESGSSQVGFQTVQF